MKEIQLVQKMHILTKQNPTIAKNATTETQK